uniref:DUF679 domain membrane protein 2 n=1 Tax=Kalanchoe fedtschenkoi TaxID=63787 RepID=A0A7N0UEI8_KALFE
MGNKTSKTSSAASKSTSTSNNKTAAGSRYWSSSSLSSNKAFTGVGNLVKLLPTGTVFLFQFLNPILTSNGKCHTVNKVFSAILLVICAFSCCFASFTDSYKGSDGNYHYGVATSTGLWPNPDGADLKRYRLRFGDFVHAFLSLIVFAVLSLLDSNTVECYYPEFEQQQKALMMGLPAVIGTLAGVVFMLFPSTRHGIGYVNSESSSESGSSSSGTTAAAGA